MPLRLVEIVVQDHRREELAGVLRAHDGVRVWSEPADEERGVIRVLLSTSDTEWLNDTVGQHLGGGADYHIVISPVEGVHPPFSTEEPTATPESRRRDLHAPGRAASKLVGG